MSAMPISDSALDALLEHTYHPGPICVGREEAAQTLGLDVRSFTRRVEPTLRAIRIGRLIRFHVGDLAEYQLGPLAPLDWPPSAGVYFVRAGDHCKIGVATNIRARLKGIQTSLPHELLLVAWLPYADASTERRLHEHFDGLRGRGEWFTWRTPLAPFVRRIRAALEPELS